MIKSKVSKTPTIKDIEIIHKRMHDVLKIQGSKGNWDADEYMQGMFNGMELMMSIFEDREPEYRKLPNGKKMYFEYGDFVRDEKNTLYRGYDTPALERFVEFMYKAFGSGGDYYFKVDGAEKSMDMTVQTGRMSSLQITGKQNEKI